MTDLGRRPARVALGLAFLLSGSAASAAEQGRELYAAHCAVCHMADGAGSPGLAPPLRNPIWQRLGDGAVHYLAGVMVSGLVGVPLDGNRYFAAMPPWLQLTDEQLAAIGTYVLQELNGEENGLTAAVVEQTRASSPSHAMLKTLREEGG